jgi:HlyD family secretion protein
MCEILIEEIPDALYVPVQAVFRHRKEVVSFVTRGETVETRKVSVGRQNEVWVQVLDGLREGETVLLSPPPGFAPELDLPARGEGDGGDLDPK